MYSSIDIFGEKEKDWETHITEIRYFSEYLHDHFYKSFVFEKYLADGYMMEKKVACRRGSYIYFLWLECHVYSAVTRIGDDAWKLEVHG
jgi:hypothetical protein